MDRETLRAKIVSGEETLETRRLIWNSLSAEDKATMTAAREAFAEDTPVTNAFLDRILQLINP